MPGRWHLFQKHRHQENKVTGSVSGWSGGAAVNASRWRIGVIAQQDGASLIGNSGCLAAVAEMPIALMPSASIEASSQRRPYDEHRILHRP